MLFCCLCLNARKGEAYEAVTIINGQAVCYIHMSYVKGGQFFYRASRRVEGDEQWRKTYPWLEK